MLKFYIILCIKIVINFRGVRFHQSSSTFCIHQRHNMLSVRLCNTSFFENSYFIQNVKEIQHCYLTIELFRNILIEQRKSHVFEKYPWGCMYFPRSFKCYTLSEIGRRAISDKD